MRYKKSAISSAQIVQAAIRVMARNGYANTSLMDIAREAGMSKGAVHYHYPSKEALIEVVLKAACDAVQERTIVAWSKGDNPFESLHASLEELWEARVKRTDEMLVVADLIAQALYDEKLRAPLAEFYQLAAQQLVDYVGAQVEPIGFRPKVPMQLVARLVLGLLDGLVMQAFVAPEAFDTTEVVHAIEMLIMSLFEVGPPPALATKPETAS